MNSLSGSSTVEFASAIGVDVTALLQATPLRHGDQILTTGAGCPGNDMPDQGGFAVRNLATAR